MEVSFGSAVFFALFFFAMAVDDIAAVRSIEWFKNLRTSERDEGW